MKKLYSLFVVSLFSVMLFSAAPTKGLQFSGVSTSVISLDPQTAFSPAEFTLEVWVNYKVLNGGGYVISTEGWSPSNHGFSLRLGGEKLEFSIGEGSNWHGITSSANITPNTWFHAAVTCTATTMKMYINGVLDAERTLPAPMGISTARIVLGDSPTWSGRLFNGQMADLRFWNIVKTPAEIVADMTSTLVGNETGLVAGWKMNEGEGTVVADITGSYNLTKAADVAWFGGTTAVELVAVDHMDFRINKNTIELTNKTNGNLKVSVLNLFGQVVFEDLLGRNSKCEKQLKSISGAYILKSVADDGTSNIKKFILQ